MRRHVVRGPALAVVRVIVCVLAACLLAACSAAVPGGAGGPRSPAPSGTGTERVVLVAAGDIACSPGVEPAPGTCQQEATAALVESLAPDAVLALGDTQYEEATLAEYASYDASWGRFLDITHPVIGNHEYFSGDADGYFGYFGDRAGKPDQGWYSVDVGEWHAVVLNSQCAEVGGCGPDSPQGRWLAADLAENPARCTLAAWHEPRFSSGAEHGDEKAVAPLWDLLDTAGADVVLNGHEHVYERFSAQRSDGTADDRGVVAFVVGTGGEELREFAAAGPNSEARANSSFGVVELTLRPDGYDWRFVGLPGTGEVDSGTATCV